jgi:MFS family permease
MMIGLPHRFRALRHRNFRLFFTGQSLSLIGTWLQQVAMGWLTWRVTGSPFLLGVVAFSANIGILVLGPFAGVLADRVDRRRALLVTQSLLLVQAVGLAVLTAVGRIEVWHLIGFALWLGTVSAFDIPLRQSFYVLLVEDRDDLPNAIALNSFMVNGARVIGPSLAGVLLALTGEAVAFALNALSFLAVIVAIAFVRWPAGAHRAARSGWWANWVDGFHYAFGQPPIRILLALVAVLAWTITPYSSLMPIYAADVYGGGPGTLGMLLAAAGVGALASTLHLAGRPSIVGLGRVIAAAAAMAGIALAAFAYLRVLPLALLLMTLVGGGVILAAASTNTILQTIVDDRMRGRVAGFFSMAFLGVAPVGNLAAGALAKAFGAPATFALNGVVCVVAALWFWRRLPTIRRHLRPTYERLGLLPGDT